MKPLPLEEVERIFGELMDELPPKARQRVLDRLMMKAFMQIINENPTWYEDNPELVRFSSPIFRDNQSSGW